MCFGRANSVYSDGNASWAGRVEGQAEDCEWGMLDTPEWSMCAHGSAGPLFLFGVLIRRSKKPFESVFQHLDRPRVGCFRQQIWIFENPCPVRSAGNGHCRLLMPIVTEVLNISCTGPSMFLSIYLSIYLYMYLCIHPTITLLPMDSCFPRYSQSQILSYWRWSAANLKSNLFLDLNIMLEVCRT